MVKFMKKHVSKETSNRLDIFREKSEQFGFWVKQITKSFLKTFYNVIVTIVGGIVMFFLGLFMGMVTIDNKKEEKIKDLRG